MAELRSNEPKFQIKRGDTFLLTCQFDFDGDKDITNVGIRSAINHRSAKVTDCTITKSDPVNGKFEISSPSPTNDWPLGALTTDIEYTINGQVTSTNTFTIVCIQDETR